MMAFLTDMTMTLRTVIILSQPMMWRTISITKKKPNKKSEEKPSILGQIGAYQNESKTEEKQKTKEQEILR